MRTRLEMEWTVTYHAEAKAELLAIKKNHPKAFEAICRTMDCLKLERNPARPKNPALNVCRIKYDAPGWYRCKVLGHTQWRVVFRLLQRDGLDAVPMEIQYACFIDPEAEDHAIQITQAGHRDGFYRRLRGRHHKLNGR